MHNRGVISNEIDFTGTLFDTRVVTTSAATVITGSDVGTALTFSVSLGRVYSFEATAEITNLPPVANAGPDRVLEWTGGQVSHQGTGDDPDGDTVTYDWSFVTAPAGSTATLTGDETPIPSFTPDLLGDYELDLTVDDGRGRGGTDVDTVKLTVEDTIPPLITKSIDGVQFESGLLTYLTSDTEITVSVTDAHSVVSCIITLTGTTGVVNPLCAEGDNVFSITGPDGAYILDANAIDESGNIGVDPITLVLDNAPPTITSAQDPSTNGAGWNKTSVTVSFTCSDTGSGIASCTSPQTVTTEGAGQVVSGTAVDNLGDIATADHTVNIDTTDPVVTPPADQIEEATSASGATASFSPPATDNLSGVDTLISAPPSGSLFPLGGTLVTHAATDVAGNSASATHTVTVVDTTSPTLTAPSPLILECNAENGLESSDPAIQAWLNSASASDLVDADPTITNDLVPGLCDVGVTKTVTFTATDDFNNSNMATSTITVVDNTAPTVTAAFEPNDKIKKDSGLYTAVFACSDNCDPSPSLKGVIRTPSLDGLEVKLKVKSRVEVKFNLKKGKVTISGPDPQAILDQINENGGLLIDSGQLIKAKVKDKYGSKPSFKFKKDGTLDVKGSSLEFVVTCEDSSGNVGTASAEPVFAPDDDDDDDD